jgi:hypothetical protein
MEREVRKGVREGTMEITVLTLVLLSFFGFFGAITTGCMRPFVPRTNENEITTTNVFYGVTDHDRVTDHLRATSICPN